MYKTRILVAIAFVVLAIQSAAIGQRRSHIGDIAVSISESGSGTVSIGGDWGLSKCAPHQLTPVIRDGNTIELAIDIQDGDILCAGREEWSLEQDFQFTNENGSAFQPTQFQVDASFYIDNVTTGVRKLATGPFSIYEEPKRAPMAYRMTGEILESISLVHPGFELPAEVPATIQAWGVEIANLRSEFYLRVNGIDDWSFALSGLAGDQEFVTHVVVPDTAPRRITRNQVNVDADQIQISFADSDGLFERFDIDLNMQEGTGNWDWSTDCPVCDLQYLLPAAKGSIDSIEPAPIYELDCNVSGRISYADLYCSSASGFTPQLLAELNLIPGDLDGNGAVDFADFLELTKSFSPFRRTYPQGDIDGDERTGFSDFLILSRNFGKNMQAATSVPEPTPPHATLALLSLLLWRFLHVDRTFRERHQEN